MKIYRYYILPEKGSEKTKYDLYAITNKKELAKEFEEARNMKRFLKRVSSDDLDVYVQFANDNWGAILEKRQLLTRTVYENGLIGHKDVEVLCTNFEYQTLKDTAEEGAYSTSELYWSGAITASVYKKKLRNALRKLQYQICYKFYRMEVPSNIDTEDDDYSAPDFWIDEVYSFIQHFKDTF